MRKITFNERSSSYDNLQWVKDNGLMNSMINAIDPDINDLILDIGTGTGVVPFHLSPFVKKIIGIDISKKMIEKAKEKEIKNLKLMEMDIFRMDFEEYKFDKVTARMVFHHLLSRENILIALKNCYNVLKEGGSIVIVEGIPPIDDLLDWWTKMFELKEERLNFKESEIESIMKDAGYFPTETKKFIMRRMSIRNWLDNSGVIEENKEKIYKMHLELDNNWKKVYGMEVFDSDIYCNFTFVIVKGIKQK